MNSTQQRLLRDASYTVGIVLKKSQQPFDPIVCLHYKSLASRAETSFEIALKLVAIEVFTDEDELGRTLFIHVSKLV